MDYYYPGRRFPAISVTGSHCEMMCPHCQGHYLQSMIKAETPKDLVCTCRALEKKGALGCLISGGCNESGSVPLPLEALHHVREETDLILNVHTGLVDEKTAHMLEKIDPYISFEVPTPHVLTHFYRLNATQHHYFTSLELLEGLKVVPHIMVGVNAEEERDTIKTVRTMGFSSLVVIVFTPTRGTPLQDMPVDSEGILQTIKVARKFFPRLVLGCMRPRIKALEESVLLYDGVAVPSLWAREKVERAGVPVTVKETCCVIE